MSSRFGLKFRLQAFALHLLASALVLTLVLGTLYLGWYRWPGWYLAGVSTVALVLIGVDLTIGPSVTFIIANPKKPRRELARDIAIIALCQCCALGYGTASLWRGRPLYYAFSENVLQMVQAYDIGAHELELGREQNPALVPHWYSLPRWIWAPLPSDPNERQKIVAAAIDGGDDVIDMPRYFKPWEQGLRALRGQLQKVDKLPYFSPGEKQRLKQHLLARGLPVDQADTMTLTGREHPLMAVFDPKTLKIVAMLEPGPAPVVQRRPIVVHGSKPGRNRSNVQARAGRAPAARAVPPLPAPAPARPGSAAPR